MRSSHLCKALLLAKGSHLDLPGNSAVLTGKAALPLAGRAPTGMPAPIISPKGTSADLSCGDTGIPCATVKLKDFTAAYNTWCKENNFRSSNARTLASELRAQGYEVVFGAHNVTIVRGLGIRDTCL